jgi:eukaryotic-like serine/threonine-protein kinase
MAIDPNWLQAQFPNLKNISPLDDGGQKSVFTADHQTDGKIVLKLFHPGANVDRAIREVDAVAMIKSARVPKILESGMASSPTGDIIWFREEFIAGRTLRDKLNEGQLNAESILRIGLHTLEALRAAEVCRIVHRDIKPENIIIEANGSAWILDFGLARHLDKVSLTATALHWGMGTAGYAPAEQFRNLKPDQDSRTDLFALGVTLYECVEGMNPFLNGARDQFEVLHRVENNLLPIISRQIDARNEMAQLILSMTRPKLSHRPATVEEALTWMQEICVREKIQ